MTAEKLGKAEPVPCSRCGHRIGRDANHHVTMRGTVYCANCVVGEDDTRFIWSRGQVRGRLS